DRHSPVPVTIAAGPRTSGEEDGTLSRGGQPTHTTKPPRPNKEPPVRQTLTALSLFAASLIAVSPASAQAPKKARGSVAATPDAKGEALFDKIDKNHDGKISKDEFRAAVGAIPVIKIKGAAIDKAFAKLDANGDGFLTKDEIKQLISKLKGFHPTLNGETL